jgi:hypothetical protein
MACCAVLCCAAAHPQAKKLEDQLYTLRAEHGLSVHSNSASAVSKYQADREAVLNERLQELTMRLNTVMIKIGESEENRSMYLKNIDHLKEETFERMTELTQLRKSAAEADAYYRKFADLHQSALQEKDKALVCVRCVHCVCQHHSCTLLWCGMRVFRMS